MSVFLGFDPDRLASLRRLCRSAISDAEMIGGLVPEALKNLRLAIDTIAGQAGIIDRVLDASGVLTDYGRVGVDTALFGIGRSSVPQDHSSAPLTVSFDAAEPNMLVEVLAMVTGALGRLAQWTAADLVAIQPVMASVMADPKARAALLASTTPAQWAALLTELVKGGAATAAMLKTIATGFGLAARSRDLPPELISMLTDNVNPYVGAVVLTVGDFPPGTHAAIAARLWMLTEPPLSPSEDFPVTNTRAALATSLASDPQASWEFLNLLRDEFSKVFGSYEGSRELAGVLIASASPSIGIDKVCDLMRSVSAWMLDHPTITTAPIREALAFYIAPYLKPFTIVGFNDQWTWPDDPHLMQARAFLTYIMQNESAQASLIAITDRYIGADVTALKDAAKNVAAMSALTQLAGSLGTMAGTIFKAREDSAVLAGERAIADHDDWLDTIDSLVGLIPAKGGPLTGMAAHAVVGTIGQATAPKSLDDSIDAANRTSVSAGQAVIALVNTVVSGPASGSVLTALVEPLYANEGECFSLNAWKERRKSCEGSPTQP